jgi:ABC-type nitrate/sulfonate/bicarbonate transport system permease component
MSTLSPARIRRRPPSSLQAVIRAQGRVLSYILPFVAVGLLWQLAVAAGWLSRGVVASPTSVVSALADLVRDGSFWSAVGHTMLTWLLGLGLSTLVAVPVGMCLGANEAVYRVFRVTIDFLRTIPPIVLLPLALLLYGASLRTGLVVVVFGSTWPLMIQTMYGVHQVDALRREVASAFELRRLDIVIRLVAPSAAPMVATGLRIAATMSLMLAIGAELLGGVPGIGAQIALAQTAYQTIPDMYAYVVVAAALGVALNLAMMRVERKAMPWHAAHRAP